MGTSSSHLLGVDYGGKHVGIAYSEGTLATGKWNFSKNEALQQIIKLCSTYKIATCVVGIPEGPFAKHALEFVAQLRRKVTAAVIEWDESLTSHEARVRLGSTENSRRRKKESEHQVAAALLLQSYIDAHQDSTLTSFKNRQE